MALNEYYVTDAGAGDGSGQPNEANAMSYATFTDFMVTGGTHTAAAGDRFNIKGAITARTTTTDVWVNGGTVTSPVIIRGYNATIGDLTSLARTNGNGPLVTTNYPTISYTTGSIQITGSFIIIEALSITSANVTAGNGTVKLGTGANLFMKRCAIVNSSTNANAAGVGISGGRVSVVDSDVSLTGLSGGDACLAVGSNGNTRAIGNRLKGGPAIGIRASATGWVIAFNTIFVSTGVGISITNTAGDNVVLYNTIVGGGADGINVITASSVPNIFIGNMITDNTGDGIDMVSTANAAYLSNLRTRDNLSGTNNAGDWITATNYDAVTTDTGGPETDYVASGSNDYRLIAASPAVGAGNPLYAAIGALQRQQAAAGGGIRIAGHGGLAS